MKKITTLIFLYGFLGAGIVPLSTVAQNKFQIEYSPGVAAPFVIDTLENGYLVAGCTNTLTAGGIDGFVMKISFSGIPLWSKVYGGIKDDQFFSVQRTRNDHFILSGSTKSFVDLPSDSGNIYLVEIDTLGSVIRSRSFGTDNLDIAYSVKETADKGFVIAGTTDSVGHISAYLIKTDSMLNTQWSHIYRNGSYDINVARSVIQTSDGGYAFTGYSTLSNTSAYNDMFIVRTDSTGSVVSSTHYSFNDSANYSNRGAFGYDIIQNSAGNLVVVGGVGGYYLTAFSNIYMWLLLEVDANGNTVYSKDFALNTGDCRALSVRQTPDGGYILGGYMGNYYLAMIKSNPSIIKQWCYYYALSYNPTARGYCARYTSDGGFILSGSLISGTSSRIVKTNLNGISGCAEAVPVGPGGTSYNISLTSLTVPWSVSNKIDTAAALTISNNTTVSVNSVCSNVGISESDVTDLFKIYPNPGNRILTLTGYKTESVTISNSLGEIILEKYLLDKIESRTDLDISALAPGIYFIKVGNDVRKFMKE